MNVRKSTLLSENPRMLDDDDITRYIPRLEQRVQRLYDECSVYYGQPCAEGKRRYDKYLQAQAVFRGLLNEAERRGLQLA